MFFVKYDIYLQRLTLAMRKNLEEVTQFCELLREIDYEIIGFEFAENNLVEINSVDDFENSQRGDYVLFPKSKREKLFSAFNN